MITKSDKKFLYIKNNKNSCYLNKKNKENNKQKSS